MSYRSEDTLWDAPETPGTPPSPGGALNLVSRRPDAPDAADHRTLDLHRYWRLAARYKWLLAGGLLLGAVAGVLVTLLTTPVYRASATVQIDEEPAKVVVVESQRPTAQGSGSEKFYQTQYELLKSRALAERVVAKENLAFDERFLDQWDKKAAILLPGGPSTPTAAERAERIAKATELVSDHLQIEPVRLSRIVKISYDSPNPRIAAKVANAVASNYITWNLERRFEASSAARRFLEGRLEQTRQSLEEAQRRSNDYAQRNQLITVDGSEDPDSGEPATGESLVAKDLATVNEQLAAATEARIKAEQRWRQAAATPDASLPEVLENASIQALETARAAARWEYQQNLRTYKPDWPAMADARKKIEGLDEQIAAQVAAIRGAMRTELDIARRNEAQFRAEVDRRKQELLDAQSKRVEQSFINTDINTSKSLYDGMLASYKEIGLAGGIGDNNVAIVDKAEAPHDAIKPSARNNIVQFGLLGLVLGALVAFLLDRLDMSIKAPADVETDLRLAVLGAIPVAAKGVRPGEALANPKSTLSEAYYSVRTALQFSTENGVPKSLLVSSSRSGEGKTTSALAIAAGFARLGQRVLLIDADMRDPSLHKLLDRDNGVGLSNLLAGRADLPPALQPTSYENLTFLACGPLPPNPAELLGGTAMRRLLTAARTHYDLVVIDGPPVMGLADAPQLANAVGGVVFVVSSGQIRRDVAKAAVRRLQVGNVRLLGAVLTKFDASKAGLGHDYGYGYEYGGQEPAKPRFGFLPARARRG